METLYEYESNENSVAVSSDGSMQINLSDCHLTHLWHEVPVEDARKIYEALKTVFDAERGEE